MEQALLVTIFIKSEYDGWKRSELAEELNQLAKGCGVHPVHSKELVIQDLHSRYLIGTGQAQILKALAHQYKANVIILNRDLSGSQQRNLEKILDCKTIDRTQLILDVFSKRAKSNEGKLQVELAQLNYLLPRLVGQGIELSRQGGGIGTRGPGEQKLETHRRRIRDRIKWLKDKLKKLSKRRKLHRDNRKKKVFPTIALIGYTNAGKSSLFNALTKSSSLVKNQLFSTLDSSVRTVILSNKQKALLADTVGFLHLLPHHLVDAFHATLEEVLSADLLVHVIDVSHPKPKLLAQSVDEVLKYLKAESKPIITVLNKEDMILEDKEKYDEVQKSWPSGIFISAKKELGLNKLILQIEEVFLSWRKTFEWMVPFNSASILHQIYEFGQVLELNETAQGTLIRVNLPTSIGQQIQKQVEDLS